MQLLEISNRDNLWIGDRPKENKPTNTFRILFNNINGLGSTIYQSNIQHLAATQHNLRIDYLGITEHCLNATQQKVHMNIYSALNQHFNGQFSFQLDSGKMTTASPYLPGGTAHIIMGPNIGRLEPQGRGGDPMGRWSYATFRRKHLPPLTIFTAYQVNPRPTNEVGITAWHQQRLQLNEQSRNVQHPRTAFIDDLITTIKTKLSASHEIIIGGDFNDNIENPRSQLRRLLSETGLIDLWKTRFPNYPTFSSYNRGSRRIDLVLCTPDILRHTTGHGYSPYNWFTNSDHRAIVIELEETSLFGSHHDPAQSQNLRGIRTNDRQQVSLFINQWHKHLKAHGIFQRVQKLNTNTTSDELESIDKAVGDGGDSAENKCRKRRCPMYSIQIAKLRLLYTITKCNLRMIKQGKTCTPTLQLRLLRHGILDLELSSNFEQAKTQMQTIRQDLTSLLATHRETRQQEQDEQITHACLTKRKDKEKMVRNIKKNEARRRTWQILKFRNCPRGSTQTRLDRIEVPASWPKQNDARYDLTQLEDPKTCTHWMTISKPDEIEYYIQLRNRSHFGQAQGTPFTISPFDPIVDWAATSPFCESILAGTHLSNISTIPQCQALLDTCKAASDLDIIPAHITNEDFEGKIKTWKESTTTSPSGRHLGRYKALYSKVPYTNDDADQIQVSITLQQQQADIITTILTLINTCISTGHILNRWTTIVNTMIFKDPNVYRIHRLRVIHIYEADFNLLLAVKWRQLLHSAEHNDLLHRGLYGGRPGCEAQSLTFLEEMKYDISYASRRSLVNFDNDATSCYDRIIVSLASLINRKYGQNRRVVTIHANTLKQAKFHLRTQFGFSDSSYSHCLQYPIFGSGQGSGNSPCIWLFISSTLCDIHDKFAHGATFSTPDASLQTTISMVGFVDDSTGICNDFKPQSQIDGPALSQKMQEDAQIWNDLLWCSGGKLELPKCSYHLLQFGFKPDGTPFPILDLPQPPINVIDAETHAIIPIPPKQANDQHKTLGHWKSPVAPKTCKQLQALLRTALDISTQISTSPLSRLGATIAYFGKYIPALSYVLPQCFYTATQLFKAERTTLQPIIAKTGYNRNISIDIRYAPRSYAGCGFIKWYTLQGDGQIQLLLKHWRTDSLISTMTRIAVSWSQWQSGLSQSFLQDTRTPLPHLESRWLKSLRGFLRSISATILLDNPYVVLPARQGDQHIMEYAIRCGSFKLDDIPIINYCRLYLNITTIADAFDSSGKQILPHIFNCTRPTWFDPAQYVTIQRRPSEYQIKAKWQRLCREWSTYKGTIAESIILGDWNVDHIDNHPRRESYQVDDCIYHWIDTAYWVMALHPHQSHYYRADRITQWTPCTGSIPIDVKRIPASPAPHYLIPLLYHNAQPPSYPPPTSITPIFSIYSTQLPQWEQHALSNVSLDHAACTAALQQTHLILTFTSMTIQSNTRSGWRITSANGHILASKYEQITAQIQKNRATHWTHLSALLFLKHFTKAHSLSTSSTTVLSVSDSSPTISAIQQRYQYITSYPNATLATDWDLLEMIYSIYREMNLRSTPQFRFERRTTPKETKTSPKNLFATILHSLRNEIAQRSYPKREIFNDVPSIPTSRCRLFLKGIPIHGKYTKHIREIASIPAIKGYLRNKYQWTKADTSSVGWQWFSDATRKYSNQHNHLTKLVYDQLPTRSHKQKQGGQTWLPHMCRHCDQYPESFEHLMQCKHHLPSETFRTSILHAITSLCGRHSVPRSFSSILHQALKSWLQARNPLDDPHLTIEIRALARAQTSLGWNCLFKGFLAQRWQVYLEFTQRQLRKRKVIFNHSAFFRAVIQTLWSHQTTFWLNYQSSLHKSSEKNSTPLERVNDLRLEIRFLYSMKSTVAMADREEYFPHNLQHFLKSSTLLQLQNYLSNYKRPILLSAISERNRLARNKRIWSFHGFTRLARPQPVIINNAPPHHPDHSNQTLHARFIPLPQERTPTHKHSKWKPIENMRSQFRTYFQSQHNSQTN